MAPYASWRASIGSLRGAPYEDHWKAYQDAWKGASDPHIAWEPTPDVMAHANLTWLAEEVGVPSTDLHAWSVSERSTFWQTMIGRLGIPFHAEPKTLLTGTPTDPVWLEGARLNIAQACWQGPEHAPAILAGEEGSDVITTWTYGELRALANRISNGLLARYSAGDAVALYMPMNAVCVAAYLGIVQAGLAVVSIPDSFAPDEVATRLRLGGAKAIITVDSFQRGGRTVPMAPKAQKAAGSAVDVLVAHSAAWDELLGAPDFDPISCDPQDVSNILFSSGTTGEPKAIPWTHLTPIKAAVDGHLHQDIHPGDVVAWPTNIGWMMGPWLIYGALANRATIALYEGVPTGKGFLDFLRRTQTSMLGVVPGIVRAWRESGVAKPGDLPKIKVFSSTGEASNAYDYLYLMSLANHQAPIIEYCGGTEIGGAHITGSVLLPAAPSVFTTPAFGLDFLILEDGQHVAPGGHGQIFLVPPSIGLSQRLLNRDHHKEYHEGVQLGPEGQVLRRHGDEVHVLGPGTWAAGGRADDTMNLGGIKVSSIELEAAMHGEGISETAAVAIAPDGGGADRLVVFAVLSEPMDDLQSVLQQRIKERLNPLFRIHDVVVIDELPRTASNKVMRRELRAQY